MCCISHTCKGYDLLCLYKFFQHQLTGTKYFAPTNRISAIKTMILLFVNLNDSIRYHGLTPPPTNSATQVTILKKKRKMQGNKTIYYSEVPIWATL